MSNIIALVPLRGGSKSIPDKNIRFLAGKPLCAWVLEAAHNSRLFDRIVVSTDSEKIANVVNKLGIPVDVIERPAELASDTATTESVMLHIAGMIPFKTIVTIQATSPLIKQSDFVKANIIYNEKGFDSLLSCTRLKRFLWDKNGIPLNYDPRWRPRRQDFPGVMMENGAFYFTKREILETTGCRLGGKIGLYEMSDDTAIEIDEPNDWHRVEELIIRRKRIISDRIKSNIRLLVVDVDGTLTDAGMYYSENGEMLKKFNTRDAKGIELAKLNGVNVAIITSEDSSIVVIRGEKLGIDKCFTGVKEKLDTLIKLCADMSISLDEVAYIGDDVNDLECLKNVGFSACPSDATEQIRDSVIYVSPYEGGKGAVRDVCERIIESIKAR